MARKLLGMFDKIDDIIYEPVKLFCDALRVPVTKQNNINNQMLEKELKEFEVNLELEKERRRMELSVDERRLHEEINQMILDNDLSRNEKMIEIEAKYREQMAKAASELTKIMASIQVESRDQIISLYTKKIKEYTEVQSDFEYKMYERIDKLKSMFPDGKADDKVLDLVIKQVDAISDRSTEFTKILNKDMENVFQIIDKNSAEMSNIVNRYLGTQTQTDCLPNNDSRLLR